MKADITIPEVENVFLAAIPEWSDDFMEKVWNVYLVNDSDFDLDGVMVVSKAAGTIDGEMKKNLPFTTCISTCSFGFCCESRND